MFEAGNIAGFSHNVRSMPVNIMWFRRDLRLTDNAALYHALKSNNAVVPVFIFDKNILDDIEEKDDSRVTFIYRALEEMQEQLVNIKSSLEVYYGTPEDAFKAILKKHAIEKVFTNTDYEPYAIKRDKEIQQLLKEEDIGFHSYKDQVIFEKKEIVKDNDEPYTVFTPYSKKWKAALTEYLYKAYPTKKYFDNFYKQKEFKIPSYKTIGFIESGQRMPSKSLDRDVVKNYTSDRDFPALHGTTRMGVHLRFGTVSIRKLIKNAVELNSTYLDELIWRDFFQMILFNFPHVGHGKAFKPAYDFIKWRYSEKDFKSWCEGKTGYPIVDAGMRELNETGFMHNRVRMITASFLTKHLLIDWRWGEAYFAKKLLDFDLAANNGGWQWAAGSGCDAAPYFRIFNPSLQTKRFDPNLEYIRKWIPELDEFSYPEPIVEHEFARKRCLEEYAKAVKANN